MVRHHLLFCLFGLSSALLTTGCAMPGAFVPASELAMAQHHAQELYARAQELQAAHDGAQQMIAGLEEQQRHLNQELADTRSDLETATERIDNLLTEREQLKQQIAELFETPDDDPMFTGLGTEIPGFEFDAATGLYRYQGDIRFDLGSAELRPEMLPILKDFVQAASTSQAQNFRILIVGHTDDQRIARPETARKHPTNWHLSTDRADAVIVQLRQFGLEEERMAAMGYSRFQPLDASTDESARARNRRVELYLVPVTGQMAHWDPARTLR